MKFSFNAILFGVGWLISSNLPALELTELKYDRTFGNHGQISGSVVPGQFGSTQVVVALPQNQSISISTATEHEGRGIIVVQRRLPNGALDRSFGVKGSSALELQFPGAEWASPTAATRHPDGRLVYTVQTLSGTYFVRLSSNGKLDPSFGTEGKSFLPDFTGVSSLAFDTRGRILVLSANGSPDAVHPAAAVVRISPAGRVDTSFGKSGWARIPNATVGWRSRLILKGNEIYGSGIDRPILSDETSGLLLFKLYENGEFDGHFGKGGVARFSLAKTNGMPVVTSAVLALTEEGSLLTSGICANDAETTFRYCCVARFSANGWLDPSFGDGGVARIFSPQVSITKFSPTDVLGLWLDDNKDILSMVQGAVEGTPYQSGIARIRLSRTGTLQTYQAAALGQNAVALDSDVTGEGSTLVSGFLQGYPWLARFLP